MAPPAKPRRRSRLAGCGPPRLSLTSDEADENGQPPRSWRDVIRLVRLRSLDAERALERGQVLGERRDRTLKRIAIWVRQLLIALEASVLRPVFGEKGVDFGEIIVQRGAELVVLLHDQGIEEHDDLLRSVYIRLEVPKTGASVTVVFAGDLLGGQFFNQIRRSA